MGIYAILSEVEDQAVQIEKARAVLYEVIGYFEKKIEPDTTEAFVLVKNTERISLLLTVVDSLLYEALPELEKVVDALLEHHKATLDVQ